MLEKRPRFCNGYHLTSLGTLGARMTGMTTFPKKLLRLPVPLLRSFRTLISKSPGIDGSSMGNSNCTISAAEEDYYTINQSIHPFISYK
jgi:hypothetical protein